MYSVVVKTSLGFCTIYMCVSVCMVALVHFLYSFIFGVLYAIMHVLCVDMQAYVDTLASAIGFSRWKFSSPFSLSVKLEFVPRKVASELSFSFGSSCLLNNMYTVEIER